MNHPTWHGRRAFARQRGSYLLETLIAILIFAFGVLGLIGLLGSSMRVTNDARYRAEASNLASAMISDMWMEPSAQLNTDFSSTGAKLALWKTKAATLLPSADITVDLPGGPASGLSPESRTVVVTVLWQMPGETEQHRHMMTAEIGKNRYTP